MPASGRSARRAIPILTAILVAACSAQTPVPSPTAPTAAPPTPVTPTASPDPGSIGAPGAGPGLLLSVTSEGGFINPVVTLGTVPQLVVDDDGRLYTPAPDANLDSGETPLIPPIDVRDLGAGGAAAIADAIRAAGLDREHQNVGVAADAGVTVFTVVLNGVEVVNRYTFAGGRPDGPGLPGLPGGLPGVPGANGPDDPMADAAAAAAFALLARLIDPSETWGASDVTTTTYEPPAFRVFAAPVGVPSGLDGPSSGPDATGRTPSWPLAAGLGAFGTEAVPDLGLAGLRTGIVQASDAATLVARLGTVPAGSQVQSDGRLWQLWIRPLLPDELGG